MIRSIKWLGTGLLLIGVTLNILNNPELQEYVYPYNLFINTTGCAMLLTVAIIEKDGPYTALNGLLGIGYLLGVINVFYPIGGYLLSFIDWIYPAGEMLC